MARYENDIGDDTRSGGVRRNLKSTRAFGCLFATLLGLAMSFALFVGNIMGDCEPDPGCHDNDGVHILQDLAVALPIAVILGIGVWFVTAVLRAVLRQMMNERLLSMLLFVLTLALVWFGFGPAFRIFFQLTMQG